MAIDFQNGGRPPSWNCFATIQDHPRSLCCWLQLPVKFHVNLIHRSEDIAIWIVRIVGLKCLFRPQKWGFGERWTPEREYSSSRPPTVTSLRKSASFKLSTIKIRWGVWPVGEFSENVTDTQTDRQTHTHTHSKIYILSMHSIGQTIVYIHPVNGVFLLMNWIMAGSCDQVGLSVTVSFRLSFRVQAGLL